ncbi:hypothetical protein ACO02O_05691 [Dirofilaria immitis]
MSRKKKSDFVLLLLRVLFFFVSFVCRLRCRVVFFFISLAKGALYNVHNLAFFCFAYFFYSNKKYICKTIT